MECGGHGPPRPGLERHPTALPSLPRSLWAIIPTHHGIRCLEPECLFSLTLGLRELQPLGHLTATLKFLHQLQDLRTVIQSKQG